MTHNKLAPNTIVQFGSLIGAVIGQLTNACGLVYNIDCGEQGIKTAKHSELTVLNTNYVNTNMRVSQFLPQIINRYEQLIARNAELASEYNTVINANIQQTYATYAKIASNGTEKKNAYKTLIQTELNKTISELKPSLRSETFYFGGLYYTDVLVIEVKELNDQNNQVRPFLFVNGKEQTDIQYGQLCQIVNQEFAGMKLNEFTTKIGSAIGYTQNLRDVLSAYDNMHACK